MRPALLDPVFAEAASLPGIGPKVEKLIARVTGVAEGPPLIRDLLFHLPSSAVVRERIESLSQLPESGHVIIEGVVEHHEAPRRHSRAPFRAVIGDGTETVELVFFNARSSWIEKILPIGQRRVVAGRLDRFDYRAQIAHPDFIGRPDEAGDVLAVEPVYPLTEGLAPRTLAKAIRAALEKLPELPEWVTPALVEREKWPSFREALRALHLPEEGASLSPESPAWRRLAFDELLASQLALLLVRGRARKTAGKARAFTGERAQRMVERLGFALTGSQESAIAAIRADLKAPERMLRLLQGDVGSGKTLVALSAMADVTEGGSQAALMAPTEVLARQHFATIAPLAATAGLKAELFTGRESGSSSKLAALAAGEIDIAIGTHALFQEGVGFKDLGLVVVDEQHRFGVHQRMLLAAKGVAPDLLVMTATPIPRTLVLTYFGDMAVSELREKPAGRRPIETRIASADRLGEVVERVRAAVEKGEKVYWVCPLVEESATSDAAAAEERHRELSAIFGDRALLLHGRMKPAEKDAAMAAFRAAEGAVLVATTVIEVGVDVPDASIIVIEHAERFGLAQLHQLRGRVGRGEKASSCLLLYKPPLGETARERLKVMRETNDGFAIAEADLKLRGEGDLLGTRQSGMPGFAIARPEFHGDLLELARAEAKLILTRLEKEGDGAPEAVRALLYLFGRDAAVRLMRSG